MTLSDLVETVRDKLPLMTTAQAAAVANAVVRVISDRGAPLIEAMGQVDEVHRVLPHQVEDAVSLLEGALTAWNGVKGSPTAQTPTREFPFVEIRASNGDLFPSCQAAIDAGHPVSNIWSIVHSDESDTWTYGPPHHRVNVLGYVATAEAHDGATYYEDQL